MPPNTFSSSARLLYFFTALVAASIVATVEFAGAGQPEAQCKGNSPKKACPTVLPADGATVSGAVTVTAVATEPVASMTFDVDDVSLAPPDTAAPYEARWDTTRSSNGTHVLKVTAVDASGKSSVLEHRINVSNATAPPPPPADTTSPTIGLTSPAAGATVSGSVNVAADASDNVAVVGVQFKVDGSNVGSEDTSAPYAVSWGSTNVANGGHVLTAVARDAAGNSSSSQRSVTVSNSSSSDTTSPTVGLTSPTAGATVSGSVSVAATASDNVGVAGVQFKVDGSNVGSEDTSAPYSVSWATTSVANGSHTVTAVARDAAGNSSSSQRSVTVSNSSSSDTTSPTVGLTSPSAGATVSGSVNVAADASDNVAVAGVQFKVDGANVGSEDTSAPYSVSWGTAGVANGSHTVTAVARDAAGNSSSSQRSVTVSNSSSSSGAKLAWAPPTLSNPVTITVTNANRRLYLDDSRDYRLNIVEHLFRELWIEGGRNIVVVGGHITIDQLGGSSSYQDNTAVKVRYGAAGGTVHLEGLLIDGAYVNDGIVTATNRNLQIQNVRVERAYDMIKNGHADCMQSQVGVGHLRVDRFTCSTQRQGFFLGDHDGPIASADIRHTNMYSANGYHLLWQTYASFPMSVSDVWLDVAPGLSAHGTFGYWVYPQQDGKTFTGAYDLNRKAVLSADGQSLWFVGSNITGTVRKGVPSGGDYVPRSAVGTGYTSPGYA